MAFLFLAIYSLTFLFVILSIFYVRGTFRFLYLVSKIQGPSLWDLVTVHARKFLTDVLPHVCSLCEFYSHQPWAFWTMTGDYVVVISDPEDIREMYQNKNTSTKPGFIYSAMADYLGEGSVSLSGGEKWRLHRRVFTPAFHKATLDANFEILYTGAENVLKRLGSSADSESVEISNIIDEALADTSIRFMASNRIILADVPKFTKALSDGLAHAQLKVMNPFKHWIQQRFHKPTQETERRVQAVVADCKKFANTAVNNFSDEVKSTLEQDPRDVFEAGVMNCLKAGGFDRDELLDELYTIGAAAVDTTKTATKITILLLALHQEEQQRVAEELDGIFRGDETPTPCDLDRMQFLDMCIKESLRLFPPGPFLARKVLQETNINGTVLPEGTNVIANTMALHRNPDVFKNPMQFQPDRFLPESAQNMHPYAYLPFSSGMRNCIGKTLAVMMMKVFLSSIFHQYKVLPVGGLKSVSDIEIGLNITLELPECRVKLVSRK